MDTTGGKGKPLKAGRFRLTEKLGEGYLGPVYRATDTETGKPVAVRFPGLDRQWDQATRAAILAECGKLRSLKHPNIVPLLEAGEDEETLYLVLELVRGQDFKALHAEGSLSIEKRLSVLSQAADGFAHAHRNGVLHCGFKPSKAVLTPGGIVRVRDFGLCRVFSRHLSRPGVRWGSSIYLAPEQVRGAECTAQSDIFTAGVVFYQVLSGVHPFEDENGNRTLDRILKEDPPPIDALMADAPPRIAGLLRTCLAKDPRDRFREMDEFSSFCRGVLEEMAEDSQVMRSELLGALRPLRVATARPEASPELRSLLSDVEALSVREDKNDYGLLNRLMSRLIEHYPLVHAVTSDLPVDEPDNLPEPLPVSTPAFEEAAPMAAKAPETPAESFHAAASTAPVPVHPGGSTPLAEPARFSAASWERSIPPAATVPPASPDPIPDIAERRPYLRTVLAQPEPGCTPGEPAPAAAQLPTVGIPIAQTALPIPPLPRGFSFVRRMPRQPFARAAVLLSVLLMLVAAYLVRGTSAALLKSMWERSDQQSAGRPGAPTPPKPGAAPVTPGESDRPDDEPRIDDRTRALVLAEEAAALLSASKTAESRAIALRALALDPRQEQATQLLQRIADMESAAEEAREEPAWSKALAGATELVATGPLPSAKQALDRLQRQYPDRPEVKSLRKRFDARSLREARDQARREKELSEAARNRQRIEDDWTVRVNGMFQQGKYADAGGALQQWLAQNPESAGAHSMRSRVDEAERALKAYEEAFSGKQYHDALAALAALEQANPAEPRLAELRRRAEDSRAAARASLSVHRLNLRGNLLLDGKALSAGDEADNESVPAGPHTLVVKGEGGQSVSRNLDLLDGQKVVLVYDLKKQQLRPMVETDREILATRRAAEEIHRFPLEHSHGLLRGSCKGELLISLQEVEFAPANRSHPFKIPFRQLGLKTDGRWVTLLDATSGEQLHSFKAADLARAANLKQVWEKLRAMAK